MLPQGSMEWRSWVNSSRHSHARQQPYAPALPCPYPIHPHGPLPRCAVKVLAILSLLGSFKRVMYVDIDIHHCDAVQVNARSLSSSWAAPGCGSLSFGRGT